MHAPAPCAFEPWSLVRGCLGSRWQRSCSRVSRGSAAAASIPRTQIVVALAAPVPKGMCASRASASHPKTLRAGNETQAQAWTLHEPARFLMVEVLRTRPPREKTCPCSPPHRTSKASHPQQEAMRPWTTARICQPRPRNRQRMLRSRKSLRRRANLHQASPLSLLKRSRARHRKLSPKSRRVLHLRRPRIPRR